MEYGDVFERLEAGRVRYVVVGGMAVALHGHARATHDLDIVVERTPAEAGRATAALISLGFVPALPLPLELLTVLKFTDASRREVDLFARFRLPFAELWSDSVHMNDASGRPVRVCSLEHLIRMKLLEGRPADLLDVEALLAVSRARAASGGDKYKSAGEG